MWRDLLITAAISLLALWALLVGALVVLRPRGANLREAVRLLPDLLRLLKNLATDAAVPRSVRLKLALLFAYLALPIDLIPDFIPVIGYADDAIIVAATLRNVVRTTGLESVRRNWPGTEDGFQVLRSLCGLGVGNG